MRHNYKRIKNIEEMLNNMPYPHPTPMITTLLIRALLEEKAVTITGLGMFYVKNFPAQIKEDVVYPPKNMIELKYSKEVEGFDFVSKFSQWEQIRIDEAQAAICEWLNSLEKGLEHNKTIFFDDFGTFSKDPSGKIVFQSVINAQLNIENEGFEPVLKPSKIIEKNHQDSNKPVKDKWIILRKNKKERDKFWFILTILLALSTLGILFTKDTLHKFYQDIFVKNKILTISKDIEKEKISYISYLIKEIKSEIDKFDHAPKDTCVLTEDEDKIEPQVFPMESDDMYISYQDGKYYVIAGSFVNEGDALRHIKQQKFEKYRAKLIVHPASPRIRVCIGVFDNEIDANTFAAQIDKSYWVLK